MYAGKIIIPESQSLELGLLWTLANFGGTYYFKPCATVKGSLCIVY